MGRKLLFGTLLGTVVVFIWMMISWMVLPWHCATLNSFENEGAVADVINEQVSDDGVYVLPNMCKNKDDAEAMKKGPFVFAVVKKYGVDPHDAAPFVLSFLTQAIGAFLISYLLLLTKLDMGYIGRVLFVTLVALTVGVLAHLPEWIWWGFSFSFVGVMIADLLIGWFLAGLAMAAFVKP
ncbi:MAG: hypothetical protein K940chlam9_01750 [Chlamydiae bacterium]|nr:hypothetical protein [Chlamydiota bacterium]